jgi:hypothetical protein
MEIQMLSSVDENYTKALIEVIQVCSKGGF